MATYTLISSNVLASSAASVTFSAIPATYTDLVLRLSLRTNNSGLNDSLSMIINSDTATNYSFRWLRGNGAAASSSSATSASAFSSNAGGVNGDTSTANTFGSIELYIPSYTVSQNKPFSLMGVGENNATTAYMNPIAALWSNTSTITQLNFTPVSGTSFLSGSSFYLYGISNA